MASPNPSKRPLEEEDNVAESPKRSKQDEENLSDIPEQENSSDSGSGSESCSEDESSSGSETSGQFFLSNCRGVTIGGSGLGACVPSLFCGLIT